MLASTDVSVGDSVRQFTLPHTPNMHLLVSSIFANKSYPRIDFLADEIDCVLDFGANIGAASIFFNFAYPNAQIYAYEPGSAAFELLQENTQGLGRITTTKTGVSGNSGTSTLHLGGRGGETSSIVRNAAICSGQTETILLRRASIEFERHCATFDLPVLKIDTEGSEVPILLDLDSRLEKVAAIYVEYHSEQDRTRIEDIMRQHQQTLFAASASHPHRGENLYVKQELLDSRTSYSKYVIPPIQPAGTAG